MLGINDRRFLVGKRFPDSNPADRLYVFPFEGLSLLAVAELFVPTQGDVNR